MSDGGGGQDPETILLVEADILIRQPLAEYLRDCGFRVVEAVTVIEARKVLESGTLRLDAVLVDAVVDEDAAFRFARWVRGSFPAISVVLAAGAERLVGRAGEMCDDGPALAKPYEHKLVLNHIKWLLARRNGC